MNEKLMKAFHAASIVRIRRSDMAVFGSELYEADRLSEVPMAPRELKSLVRMAAKRGATRMWQRCTELVLYMFHDSVEELEEIPGTCRLTFREDGTVLSEAWTAGEESRLLLRGEGKDIEEAISLLDEVTTEPCSENP